MKTLNSIVTSIVGAIVGLSIGLGFTYLQNKIEYITIILLLFVIIAGAVAFLYLTGQVTNHLPSQIKQVKQELKEEVKKVKQEVKEEVKEVRQEVKEVNTRLDKIYEILYDILAESKKPQK